MKIVVVGTGYVGLVTGTCFAEAGNQVICVDIDEAKVQKLRGGEIPIFEPGLSEMVLKNGDAGNLSFTTNLAEAIKDAEIIFLALPTPSGADGAADLSAVLSVGAQLGSLLDHYVVVVNKSTVPVGTADKVRAAIGQTYSGEFDVVSNPEFLREGLALHDFMQPDRVVIGSSSQRATDIMTELYKDFIDEQKGHPLLVMDEYSAELSKYASNSFLALKISFINEIANLAERVGADVEHVARAMGADERIGRRFLQAGIGYGGSCFPKDVLALNTTAKQSDYDFKLLSAILEVNKRQKAILIDKITAQYGTDLSGKTFGVLGLAFKPDTDDIREAPALVIIDALLELGATVKAYDPEASDNVARYYENAAQKPEITELLEQAVKDVDAVIVATEWQEFKNITPERLKQLVGEASIFDGRNIFDPSAMTKIGLDYKSIGRQ